MRVNYKNAKLRPQEFSTVLTQEVGFETVQVLYMPESVEGFERPIYAYWKNQ